MTEDIRHRMRDDWDSRARENARDYIATNESEGIQFYLSGLRDAFKILEDIHADLAPEMRLLEIGCGMGRMLRFWSQVFAEVQGVDISPEMLKRGREYLAHLDNVNISQCSGDGFSHLPDRHFDLVISYVVFQHIPDKATIGRYIGEARRVIKPGGIFKFHVKTGPWKGQGEHDSMFGVEITKEDVDAWARATGFKIRNTYSDVNETAWVIMEAPNTP